MAQATVFNYFPTKEDLFALALLAVLALVEVPLRATPGGAPARDPGDGAGQPAGRERPPATATERS